VPLTGFPVIVLVIVNVDVFVSYSSGLCFQSPLLGVRGGGVLAGAFVR
jgi:hypothetical protein